MNISEIFYSLQGEGKLLGVPSVFVRTSGCNLRCAWCDTPYASWEPEKNEQSLEAIIADVNKHPTRHVVITGGEPMIQPEFPALVRGLKERGYHITTETAGTVFHDLPIDLLSISPKLSNSTPWQREGGRFASTHEAHRINLPVLQRYAAMAAGREADVQWKFVVSVPGDLAEIESLMREIDPRILTARRADILLMPEGTTPEVLAEKTPWLAALCRDRGYRFCPRLHVALYGNRRGT